MSEAHALAQLRHLYAQMVEGRVKAQEHAAIGLLGPAIEELEKAQAARSSRAWEAERLLETAAQIAGEPSAYVEDKDAARERKQKAARIRALARSPEAGEAPRESVARSFLRTLRDVVHASPEVIAAAERAVEEMERGGAPGTEEGEKP
jgi:hypothetical protein